ncbi:RIP metalloprotease RseP [Chthonobacter albigriseus]|uniref:RIP metalloprotease RseP n=1 Tax=Chthonobacter albigriseus TaxID=1683161 RepID=UPI0015EF29EA|nr:RIP metalloprotease RseP [Chthonobacter albigriseus]
MESLSSIGSWTIGTILAFLVVLTVVVFIHELGHFLVARWCGVKVRTFSIGFGKEIFGFTDRHGTRWQLASIPLGGYVKFIDDMNPASVPDTDSPAARTEGAFQSKSVAQRAAVVAAGPIANFILAIVIFTGVFMAYGKVVLIPRVDEIQAGSAAEAAGFQKGDLVLEIDGRSIESFSDISRIVSVNANVPLIVVVERNGERLTFEATPRSEVIESGPAAGNARGLLGLKHSGKDAEVIRLGPLQAFAEAGKQTWYIIDQTFTFIGHLFRGYQSIEQLSGPVGIAKVAGEAASLGILPFINLAAFLSVSIGLFNLFPIPLLDGGHLLFYAIEAIRGRSLSARKQELGFAVGAAVLFALMAVAMWNDISRLITG